MNAKKSSKTVEKLFGLLVIALGLAGLYKLYVEGSHYTKAYKKELKIEQKTTYKLKDGAQSQNKLTTLWRNDFDTMKKELTELPTEFNDVASIRVYMLDKNLHPLLENLKAPIRTQKASSLNLEVSFISHFSEELKKDVLIIQYNFIDIDTENMILETSRQIVLEDQFLKK